MSTEGKACPIISAFSELKQFSDYPKCSPDCAWLMPPDWEGGAQESECLFVRLTQELGTVNRTLQAIGTVHQLLSAVTGITGEKGVPIPSLPFQVEQLLTAITEHYKQQAATAKKPPKGPRYYGSSPHRAHLRWAKRALRRERE